MWVHIPFVHAARIGGPPPAIGFETLPLCKEHAGGKGLDRALRLARLVHGWPQENPETEALRELMTEPN